MKNRRIIQSYTCTLIIVACLCFTFHVDAQENVGIGTNLPHPSAKLDVVSFDQGVLVPRLKEAQRLGIVEPAEGLLVYDRTYGAFYVFDGLIWKQIIDENQVPIPNHIIDEDEDTWIHTENNPDDDKIIMYANGVEIAVIDSKTFGFKSPGNSLFIGENSGLNDDGSNNSNLFIGQNSGKENTFGSNNIAIGHEAGEDNVGGFRNLLIGNGAGSESTFSTYNVVVGNGAGIDMTNGSDNVLVGDDAGKLLGNGGNNVLLGSQAGRFNEGNSHNLMIGSQAGYNNVNGNKNVLLGFAAGRNGNGEKNVFIGHKAGESEMESERLYIDNSNTAQPLIYGKFDTDELTVNGSLKIKDEYIFPIVDGEEGEVLGTNGAGILDWVENTSVELVDLDLDTKIQVEELPDEDVIRFDLEGSEVLVLDKNAFGMARLNLNPVNSSIMIGNGAGENNQGFTNVFIGKNAGTGNSAGFGNSFIGSSSGELNIDGSHNTYMGLLSGHINNGSDNVMLGQSAGSEIYYGDQNVLIGSGAGRQGTLASRNIKIGYNAGSNDHTDDKLYIDNTGTNAPLIFGDFQQNYLKFYGKVGVYADPEAQLHVKGFTSAPAVRVDVNNVPKLLVNENGGTTVGSFEPNRTPNNGLYVEGDVNLGHLAAANGYRLSVDGKVICEELRVEDSGDWPDYVFESDYKLLSLSEVDAFIKKEGHLPNIQPAAIVEAEGFDTGDMVKKLLEKVEELTLHAIQQQKQIDKLLGKN